MSFKISPQCKQCHSSYEITHLEYTLREQFSLPAPTLCPDCRLYRRLLWRNERSLFKRSCNLCATPTISMYKESITTPVYCPSCWWGDMWDPQSYAKGYDTSRPFLDQFYELQQRVPRLALLQSNVENSAYTNCVSYLKDCYLLFSSDYSRACLYGVGIEKSTDCVDCFMIDTCELCYECSFSKNLYECRHVKNSEQCSFSDFLVDCRGCTDCICCTGLSNQRYCFKNEQLSKEEFEKIRAQLRLHTAKTVETCTNAVNNLISTRRSIESTHRGRFVDSSGSFLWDVERCHHSTLVFRAQDCAHLTFGVDTKQCVDGSYVNGEYGIEQCECFPMPSNSYCNLNCYGGSNLAYCDSCMYGNNNLLGCIGLRHAENCILNTQYSPSQYNELRDKIIEELRYNGELGEFFDASRTFFTPQESIATDFFSGLQEVKEDTRTIKKAPPGENHPQCKKCSSYFRITQAERAFYEKLSISPPMYCFECRHRARVVTLSSSRCS
jgi:hypothetical protein